MFSYAKSFSSSIVVLVALISPVSVFAIELNPQSVVDLALKQSPKVRQAEFNAMKTEATAEKTRGAYDLILSLSPTFEYTEAQSLTGTSNPIDRTWTVLGSLSKKFSSGTALTLDYTRISQDSTLSSFTSSLRRPTANLNSLQLTIRQAIWNNIFGEADRATLAAADALTLSAQLAREESLEESILNSLSLFWNAFVAEIQLRENSAARQKYEELVKAVRRKAGFNLSTPGELPRLEAEFESADSRVKQSSQQYLAALDTLKTNLQIDRNEPVKFNVKAEEASDLPVVPKLKDVAIERLRPYVISKIALENADRDRVVAVSTSKPKLDLVAKARTTGVDEQNDLALSEMTSGSKPTYSVGVELYWPLDSATFRGTKAAAEAAYQISRYDLKLAEDGLKDQLANAERSVAANHDSALSSIEIVSKRTRVVKELEGSYRQGRTPLVELIRAYNDLFQAQQDRAKAIGNYQIALNQWAATRDELVKNERGVK